MKNKRFKLLLATIVLLLSGVFAYYRPSNKDIVVMSHRGSFNLYPQSTISSLQKAKDAGANLSIDIQYWKDGNWVYFHDWNLKKLYCKDIDIQDAIYETVKFLPYCGKIRAPNIDKSKVHISLYEEVLDLFGSDLVEVELKYLPRDKSRRDEALHKILKISEKYLSNIVFTSFNPDNILALKSINNKVRIGFIYMNVVPPTLIEFLQQNSSQIDVFDGYYEIMSDELISVLKENNYEIWVFDMEELMPKERALWFVKKGVKGFVVNEVEGFFSYF